MPNDCDAKSLAEAAGGLPAPAGLIAPDAALAPALYGASGLTAPSANFLQGIGGKERAGFVSLSPALFGQGWGTYGGVATNRSHRDRTVAATISTELLYSNPTLKTLVETLTVHTCGPNGLTLSSMVDAEAAEISDVEAMELNRVLERVWNAWVSDPLQCDLGGRFDFHTIAAQAFVSYLTTGETVAFVDVGRSGRFMTRANLVDPRIISLDSKTVADGGSVFQGCQFSREGRFEGMWVRKIALGAIANVSHLEFVSARTRWGRQRIVHLLESLTPGTVRGLPPLVNSLAAVVDRDMLNQILTGSFALQASFALALESSLPAPDALKALELDEREGVAGAILDGALALREQWYGRDGERSPKLRPEPGQVAPLAPGDKLNPIQPARISDDYESFNRSLTLDAARAAGAAGSDISGDYSKTSFSASRMEQATPARVALKRRREIVAPFYQAFYSALVEEAIMLGEVELPAGAVPFHNNPAAYTGAKFLGPGAAEPDRLKSMQADVLSLANHTSTLTEVLQAKGIDFGAHIETLKREHAALLAAGLSPAYATVARTQLDETEQIDGKKEE